ncbi:MAG: 6-hydroxycyclohex-1-ene-1-carbonyl-CoA dehydrogenase [FCB group bacterium]|nr:6-hydroxycyclohex-1-ene-1-carbonyl-CoA dehydrogenase [FCB group bacterium]
MEKIKAYGYFYTAPGAPLERREFALESIDPGEVIVKIAGCGLCHTDLGFLSGAVQTRHELPLVLGHEISGEVLVAGAKAEHWAGKKVLIPAVLPCGDCELCKAERDNICQYQKMPGNDFNGGFASHIRVPSRFLCELPEDLGEFRTAELSVIADAVTTPYQSLVKSGLQTGDLAIVIGVGGIGIYMVQHAHNAGAVVIALDIDDDKLETARQQGADHILNSRELQPHEVKKQIRGLVKAHSLPPLQWKIFETSGTAQGQTVAFALLSFAGTLGIVGFTMEKLTLRLSNIMAFDATVFGNWGCRPAHYPEVVRQVLTGGINLKDNIEMRPLSSINETIELARAHKLGRRVIFQP